MYLARILYPVQVLGPGARIGIWTAGCRRHCQGCSNPELWETNETYRITVSQALQLLQNIANQHQVDGLTITGGEPMDQAAELAELLEQAAAITQDVLLYTGYRRAECNSGSRQRLLARTAVLIDGPYEEDRNDNSFLRGSSNQAIHILKEDYQTKYQQYLRGGRNQIENFMLGQQAVSVGIHQPGFQF